MLLFVLYTLKVTYVPLPIIGLYDKLATYVMYLLIKH